MHSGAILAKEIHDLRAANERQKQKRNRSRKQISHESGLSVQEAQELIERPGLASLAQSSRAAEPASSGSQRTKRAPQKCSGCGIIGHKISKCPNGFDLSLSFAYRRCVPSKYNFY